MEVQVARYADDTTDYAKVWEYNTGSTSTETSILKTPVITGGLHTSGAPGAYYKKRLVRIRATYKTDATPDDAMSCKIYVDGVSSPTQTIAFVAKSGLGQLTLSKNTTPALTNHKFKTIEVQIECAGDLFILDELVLEWTWMGAKD